VAAFYFDTSAIVKRYVLESGSGWVTDLLNPAARNRIYVARISAVEVASAIARRQRDGSLTAEDAANLLSQFSADLKTVYHVVEMTAAVLTVAVELATLYALRAYDAVQLAAAVSLNRRRLTAGFNPLTLISSDKELNAAAAAVGLAIDDPNSH
jgi:predicted nucleic acid-binding protein